MGHCGAIVMIVLEWETCCSPFLGRDDAMVVVAVEERAEQDAPCVGEIRADDDDRGRMEPSESRFTLQELSVFEDSLDSFEAPPLGPDMNDWTGAQTNSDGACGLHSLFGVPDNRRRLHCENARQHLVDALPASWEELLAMKDLQLIAEARECLREQKDAVREYLDAGSQEGQMIFAALPDRTRQQVLMQVET